MSSKQEGNWQNWAKQEKWLASGIEISKARFALSIGKLEGDLLKYVLAKCEELHGEAMPPECAEWVFRV